MKFLCSNCKAKYQIADERVVGREVRIRCRKCGEIIDVSTSLVPPPPESGSSAPAELEPRELKPIAVAPTAKPSPAGQAVGPVPRPPSGFRPPPAPSAPRAAGVGGGPPPRKIGGPGSSATSLPPPARLGDAGEASVSGGALAGAFSAAVAAPPVAVAAAPHVATAGEWHVGINGASVGPIKLSELRAKAIAGAVGLESLVWREGFEEWKPLGSFPELAAIIEEGVSSLRASVAPLANSQEFPQRIGEPSGDSDTGRAVTAADWAPPQQRQTPTIWWIVMMVVIATLAMFAGSIVFPKVITNERIVTVREAAGVDKSGLPSTEDSEASGAAEEQTPGAGPGTGKTKRVSKGANSPAATTPEPAAKPAESLRGLGGIKLAGPALGGPAGTRAAGGGGAPLDQAAVQAVVSKYSGSVKRACWQPALDARDRSAPSSANVTLKITVGTSGSVQSVSSTGDPTGYRGLAPCIEQRVRGWQFPPTSETTTVNVPFKFFSQ